jgi:hypothetical protein
MWRRRGRCLECRCWLHALSAVAGYPQLCYRKWGKRQGPRKAIFRPVRGSPGSGNPPCSGPRRRRFFVSPSPPPTWSAWCPNRRRGARSPPPPRPRRAGHQSARGRCRRGRVPARGGPGARPPDAAASRTRRCRRRWQCRRRADSSIRPRTRPLARRRRGCRPAGRPAPGRPAPPSWPGGGRRSPGPASEIFPPILLR